MAEIYTSEKILDRMLDYTDDGYDKDAGGFIYDVQKPVSMELSAAHTRMENLDDRHHADTAVGDDLDEFVKPYGLTRKLATFAHCDEVVFYGTPGAVINAGDRVANETGILFYVSESGTISENGECILPVVCATATSKGNLPVGTINKMPVIIKGVTKVENRTAATGGSNRETDEQLRQRYYNRASYILVPGSAEWYEDEAMSVDGVGNAKCIPTWNGGGTVKLIILDTQMQPADESTVERVKEHFTNPIVGAVLTVDTFGTLEINIKATVVLSEGYDPTDVKSEFAEKVSEYLKKMKIDGDIVYINQIGSFLFNTEGVLDYDNLTLNDGAENIIISAKDNKVPTLGGVRFE